MEVVATKKERREWVEIESEGHTLFGMLHKPCQDLPFTEKKHPVVVMMHGFASHKVGTNRSFVRLAQALCERGIAALRFDFRGAGDSEGDFSEMTFEGLVSDALAVLHQLERTEEIDPKRMGVLGSSLGGSVAVHAASEHGGVKALGLWAPVASGQHWFLDFLVQNPGVSKEQAASALKTYQGVKVNPLFQEQFAKMNALQKLAHLRATPLLHIHGEEDEKISLEHQKAYQKGREGAQASTRFTLKPKTDHILGLSPHFDEIVQESAEWFEEHL